jgi:hypothetical protein
METETASATKEGQGEGVGRFYIPMFLHSRRTKNDFYDEATEHARRGVFFFLLLKSCKRMSEIDGKHCLAFGVLFP